MLDGIAPGEDIRGERVEERRHQRPVGVIDRHLFRLGTRQQLGQRTLDDGEPQQQLIALDA